MAPKRPAVKLPAALLITPLTGDEMTLLASAVRLDSALRCLDDDFDRVNKELFIQSIGNELDMINKVFDKYPRGQEGQEQGSPRIHPIADHVAEVWESAELTGVLFNLRALSLEEVATRCAKSTAKNPSWPNELHAPDLRPYLNHVDAEDMWWLPRPPAAEDEDMHPETELNLHVPATPETSTASENVEMMDDDDGDARPKSARTAKRTAVASPSSDVPKKRRQRIEDPEACGPCKEGGRLCKANEKRLKSLACESCTKKKIKCNPLAKWARELEEEEKAKAKPKKRSVLDAVDDIVPTLEALRTEFRTAMAVQSDKSCNQDKILHAILSALNQRIPNHNSGAPPSISVTTAASTASPLDPNSLTPGSRNTGLQTAGSSEVAQEEELGFVKKTRFAAGGVARKTPSKDPSAAELRKSSSTLT